MMDAGSTVFERELIARLKTLSDERAAHLADGLALDFADYRHRVGYLRALADVMGICGEIAKPEQKRERNGA